MGNVKMFEIVLLWCIINIKCIVIVDAYDVDFNGKHTDNIVITMDIDGAELTLDLTLNKQLLPEGFFHKHQMNGGHETFRPNFQETNLCEYTGKVRGVPNSWVAISTCEGISGVIFDGNELHYVKKETNMLSGVESAHYLYSHSNLAISNRSCGYEDSDHHEHVLQINNRTRRYKRFANQSTVLREPYNANEESRYVELLLVMDNEVYREHGESKLRTLNHAKNIVNIVDALYARLNIFVALVGVVIWTEFDEITITSDAEQTITNFLKYRRDKLVQKYPNDNAQLITKQNFENGTLAKSLKGLICTFEYSGGVNTDFSPVGLIATSVAHSLGHNFGMEHDTAECKCPRERCIMSNSFHSAPLTDWSSCSVNSLRRAFSQKMDYCLKNVPKWLGDGPVCGNGFLEEGEQCDCGLPEYCDNCCCNAATCMMRTNATCAHGQCCDIDTCSLKAAGTLCRSAISECDLEEYCSGYSDICPVDYHKLDAEVCDSGNAYCYQGSCKTRTDQCKLLWGETGESNDIECYKANTLGTGFGNCGYNRLNNSYIKCEDGNQLCGMLQCDHKHGELEFGMESAAILSYRFINKAGVMILCRTALVDLGLDQIDPGLTPNGAPCGLGLMCVDQKCISVSEFRNQGHSCLRDCNGNGWCNNKGNCHCKAGFAPPYCDSPGPGGSLDSGPASDPKALWKSHPQPPSSSATTDTATPVDNAAIHPNNPKQFNDAVTNSNEAGTKSDTTTNLNNTPTIPYAPNMQCNCKCSIIPE